MHITIANLESCTTTFERISDVTLPTELLDDSEVYERLTPSECYDLCYNNAKCGGYLLHHVIGRCVLVRVHPDDLQQHLLEDGLWSYHRKICLMGKLCHRQWSFDRSSGYQLYGYEDKIIRSVETEDRCIQHCIGEESFICRSARYDLHNKTCVLSRHDRRTAPEAFRKSRQKSYYLENQCISEPAKCSFTPKKDKVIVHRHVHVERNIKTLKECELICLNHSDFICRTFSHDDKRHLCMMTPEDSYSVQTDFGITSEGRTIYERGSCIEVEMKCEATTMTAIIKVITPFRGRVYALGHPYECYAVTVGSNGEVSLSMPLHGRKCGTKNLANGTFTNSVVVQHHPFILRTSDRRINIACDYEEVQRKLRGGKQVLEGDLQSLTQVVTGLAPTPPVRLRVLNSSGEEVNGVDLGEPLYLKVEMMDESVFGIFGSDLVARSGQGTETVLLVDDRGCPLEPTRLKRSECKHRLDTDPRKKVKAWYSDQGLKATMSSDRSGQSNSHSGLAAEVEEDGGKKGEESSRMDETFRVGTLVDESELRKEKVSKTTLDPQGGTVAWSSIPENVRRTHSS
ncbi:uncharacterized protein LOC111616142 [Centruroides sculpturatus]|uniref:uncharacterized protein LOC111616142 n=1 Tax=Centruroides sculpturatus TaxID=218467 RepID=UPI000C6E1133|nr:uncharacterized protein LOC111616142 [Centruroides sculpturatus]